MLAQAAEGGEFEYAPFIRGDAVGDERFADVQQLFRGDWPTKRTRCGAGALAIFNGCGAGPSATSRNPYKKHVLFDLIQCNIHERNAAQRRFHPCRNPSTE